MSAVEWLFVWCSDILSVRLCVAYWRSGLLFCENYFPALTRVKKPMKFACVKMPPWNLFREIKWHSLFCLLIIIKGNLKKNFVRVDMKTPSNCLLHVDILRITDLCTLEFLTYYSLVYQLCINLNQNWISVSWMHIYKVLCDSLQKHSYFFLHTTDLYWFNHV